MLLITQQLVDEEQQTWQDVAVPHDVHTTEDWQLRLERHGILGTFKAVEVTPVEGTVRTVFRVVLVESHRVDTVEETTVEGVESD